MRQCRMFIVYTERRQQCQCQMRYKNQVFGWDMTRDSVATRTVPSC